MDNKTVDIRGKELHLLRRILNRQQSRNINDHFTVEALTSNRFEAQYGNNFLPDLEKKGLIYYKDGYVYVTDLTINSIREKEIREHKIINEHIIDDFEYAFLLYMNNRNEPVHIFDFPYDFQYHSKIHMQPVEGHTNLFRDWMDEVQKYIHDPTIWGFVLNETGKTRFEKRTKDKELEVEKQNLEMQKLRTEVRHLTDVLFDYDTTKFRAKWGFYGAIATVILTAISIFLGVKGCK